MWTQMQKFANTDLCIVVIIAHCLITWWYKEAYSVKNYPLPSINCNLPVLFSSLLLQK